MKREDIERLHEIVIEENFHRGSEHVNALSCSDLVGPMYKAGKKIINKKDRTLPAMNKRSAAIGTGFHMLAEKVVSQFDDVVSEHYEEEYLSTLGLWLSGTYDVAIQNDDGQYELGDFKTEYGTSFKNEDNARVQMSIYRWLNRKNLDMSDTAHIWFVSQSNNAMEHTSITLMSLDETTNYIRNRIKGIQEATVVDCNVDREGNKLRFNMCSWCEYECGHRKS